MAGDVTNQRRGAEFRLLLVGKAEYQDGRKSAHHQLDLLESPFALLYLSTDGNA